MRHPCPLSSKFRCTKTFAQRKTATRHAKLVHLFNRDHPCPVADEFGCTKRFVDKYKATRHADSVHLGKKSSPCPLSDSFQCSLLFADKSEAKRHAEMVHQKKRDFPCPFAEDYQCHKKFTTRTVAARHANIHGPRIRLPCPFARESRCGQTFSTKIAADTHAKYVHLGVIHLCPLAETYKCRRKFASNGAARRHASQAHIGVAAHTCPVADRFSCSKSFETSKLAQRHADVDHFDKKYPCPLAEQFGCDKKFTWAHGAKEHAAIYHPFKKKSIRCPLADKFHCTVTFMTKYNAKKHADQVHLRIKNWTCVLAEECKCQERFFNLPSSQNHARDVHLLFKCWIHGCYEAFLKKDLLIEHVNDDSAHSERDFFLCPFPTCPFAIRREAMQRKHKNSLNHLSWHRRRGELTGTEALHEYKPSQTSRCDLYNHIIRDTFLDLTQPITSMEDPDLQQLHGRNSTEKYDEWNSDGSADGESDIESDEVDLKRRVENVEESSVIYDDVSSMLASQIYDTEADDGSFGSILLSIEKRQWVLAQNTQFWCGFLPFSVAGPVLNDLVSHRENHPIDIYFVGLSCSGRGTLKGSHFRWQPCPFSTVLDLDNAYLERTRTKRNTFNVKLSPRCVACHAYDRFMRSLHNLQLISDNQETVCSSQNCIAQARFSTKYCSRHLIVATQSQPQLENNLGTLQKCVQSALAQQWALSGELKAVIHRANEIRDSKRAGSDLVILDLEFSQRRHRILEVAIVEYVSGKVIIDTKVEHNSTDPCSSRNPNPLSRIIKARTELKFQKRVDCQPQSVHEVAQALRSAGLNPKTMFLVWHVSFMDLVMLRDFLQSAGYDDILPQDEHCVRAIPILRSNILPPPGRASFPAKLEVVFPLLFPRHELVGLNHRAIADCLQTRLLIMTFEKLTMPAWMRPERQPTDLAGNGQQSLDSWLS